MKRAGAISGACGLVLAACLTLAAGAAPTEDTGEAPKLPEPADARLYGLNGSRFVVAADPGEEGLRLARLAEAAWEAWLGPLALPDRLPVPITVRLSPADKWTFPEPWWRVVGEPGGVVSVWIRGGGAKGFDQERRWLTALAEGALHRQAMFLGAGPDRLATPQWLTAAAAEAVLVKSNPALLDAWQQEAAKVGRMPPLRSILIWSEAQVSTEGDPRRLAVFGTWQWLQAESGRTVAWRRFIAALLVGTSPGLALVQAYPEKLGKADAAEIELAWQVGAAGMARARTTPLMDAEESRRRLEEADRLVVAGTPGGTERVLRLGELWKERGDAFIATERESRILWLTTNFARMHPFYRNAAGSLGRVFTAQGKGNAREWTAALADWRNDLAAGSELEKASASLLDEASR